MPIYDYKCGTCGHEFDELVSMSGPNPPCSRVTDTNYMDPNDLPKADENGEFEVVETRCEGETTKVMSKGGTFHLKGGGWEADGY